MQVGFQTYGKFNSVVKSYRVDLRGDVTAPCFFKEGEPGGGGVFDYPIFDKNLDHGDDYSEYLGGRVIWRK